MKLAHLMALLASCTLAIVFYRSMTPSYGPGYDRFLMAYDLVMGSITGAVVTAGLVLLGRWWRREPGALSRPGHWLILLGLSAVAADIAAMLAYYSWVHIHEGLRPGQQPPYLVAFDIAWQPQVPGLYHQAVGWGFAAAAGIALSVSTWSRLGRRWAAFFLAFAAGSAAMSAMSVTTLMDPWSTLGRPKQAALMYADLLAVWSSLLVLGLAIDARDRPRRSPDGLHATGVGSFLGAGLIQVIAYVGYVLIP